VNQWRLRRITDLSVTSMTTPTLEPL